MSHNNHAQPGGRRRPAEFFGRMAALVSVGILLAAWSAGLGASAQPVAVDPNLQSGQCGPFYIWYQTGPDEFSAPTDYVDLHSITFDISDVVDDFDFVYFTGDRRALDANSDGISNRHFARIDGNLIKWVPQNGRARITHQGCWAATFDQRCGYAMISIQPKPWYQNGSARIPVHVKKTCSPNGIDCSETHQVQHTFSGCEVRSLPDFVIRKEVNIITTSTYVRRFESQYLITVENTTKETKSTELTDTITSIVQEGLINLTFFNIDCPTDATCQIKTMSNNRFTLELLDIPASKQVVITYQMIVDRNTIARGQKTYFTNTATLSTGGSSQVTIGVDGGGEGREERPRQ